MSDDIVFCIYLVLAFVLTVVFCYRESKIRKIGFIPALLFCMLATPLFGYFLVCAFPLRNPVGCGYCGNEKNEAEVCRVCGRGVK